MTSLAPRVRTAGWRPRRHRDERGVAAIWLLILAAIAFPALVGLVGGGGELINYQIDARRTAEQAARAGADELSEAAIRSGADQVNASAAIARARGVLADSGWDGTVQVSGSTVIVTATGTRKPTFLPLLLVTSVDISETGTATAISSPGG